MTEERMTMIRERLTDVFSPQALIIIVESAKHAGHASAGCAGHFVVEIVSDAFDGNSLIQRHRQVYEALDDIMHSEIHALSIKAYTPAETGY